MESYIPLVKAIIISTMFSWGTSSVTITDRYMLKENAYKNKDLGEEKKEYEIYDLRRNVIHDIDQQMQFRVSTHIDTLHKYELQIMGGRGQIERLIKTTVEKSDFGGYKCKMETKEMEKNSVFDHMELIEYSVVSYFAKIHFLDSVLDTKDKKEFAGFYRQDYSPYTYLIYEFNQTPNQSSKDRVLRVIEKTQADTTLIHTLLSLPPGKDGRGVLRDE